MNSKIAVLACALLTSGCSVGMAVSGSDNPDLSVARSGAARSEIELHLGPPIKVTELGNGLTAAIYQYEIGNQPSAGRAIGHGVMDVATLGLWELIGTPIEGVQGETHTMTVTYDESDHAVGVRGN